MLSDKQSSRTQDSLHEFLVLVLHDRGKYLVEGE